MTRNRFGSSGEREKVLQMMKLRFPALPALVQKISTKRSGERLPLSKSSTSMEAEWKLALVR